MITKQGQCFVVTEASLHLPIPFLPSFPSHPNPTHNNKQHRKRRQRKVQKKSKKKAVFFPFFSSIALPSIEAVIAETNTHM
jgi:hypothetical protein